MQAILDIYAQHEPHRFRCEVQHVIALRATRGEDAPRHYLSRVQEKRGKEAADALMAEAVRQWKLGNRRGNDWKTEA